MLSRSLILLPLFFFLDTSLFSQDGTSVPLHGRVVEVSGGKAIGLSDVKVVAVGQSWDFTREGGYFTLYVDPKKEFVVFSLENCPHPVISPLGKKVNMPPPGEVEIRVCAAENQRLRQRVAELEQQVKRIENKRLLTQRQLEHLHDSLTAVILDHEETLRNLEAELLQSGQLASDLRKRVDELEQRNRTLEDQLMLALEESYLRRKKAFDAIVAALRQYNDQVKNLRDMAYPERLSPYFSNPAALEEWNKAVTKYNDARRTVVEQHENHVADAAHYWSDPSLSADLRQTYDYLLDEVHTLGVYPMEFTVNENLKLCWSKQKGRMAALRDAKKGADAAIPALAPLIRTLEEKSAQVISSLQNGL